MKRCNMCGTGYSPGILKNFGGDTLYVVFPCYVLIPRSFVESTEDIGVPWIFSTEYREGQVFLGDLTNHDSSDLNRVCVFSSTHPIGS